MADADWARVGRFIAERRYRLGYRTQFDFAEALGIKRRTVGSLESGERAGHHTPGLFNAVEDLLGLGHDAIETAARTGRDPRDAPDPDWIRLHAIWRRLDDQGRRAVFDFARRTLG